MEDYFDAVLKTRIQKVVYSKDWKGGKPSSRESGVSHVFKYLRIESYEDCVSRLIACFSRSKNDPEATEADQGQRIDLVETFNFLIGLTASVMTPWAGFSAEFQRDSNGSLAVSDFRADPEGPWRFRSVIGTTQDGNHALVIWRSLTNREEEDDLVLNQWFALQNYASEICDARLIYVHGKNNLKSLKRTGDAWEVRTVEEEFQRLVWDQGKL
jgi:adenine-specific DNA-methyltransferase